MNRLARLVALVLVPLAHAAQKPAPAGDGLVLYSAGVDQLLVDENDAGLARVLELLDERALDLGRELGGMRFPAEGTRLFCDLLSRPFCLRLGPATDPAGAPFHLQLTVSCESPAEAQNLSRRLVKGLRSAGMPLEGGRATGWTLPTPVGTAALHFERVGDATQLRFALGEPQPESFTFADAGLPKGVVPAVYARFDGKVLGPLLAPAAMFGGAEVASALKALEILGLLGPDATARTWALGYNSERAFVVARETGHTARARATGHLVEESISRKDFARVPVDAGFVGLRQFRATAWLDVLDAIEPGLAERARLEIRRDVGVDLREELLAPLGPTAGLYASRGTGGGGLMSLVGFIELNDAPTFRRAMATLAEGAQRSFLGRTEGRVAFRGWRHGDVACTSLAFPGLPIPLDVSFAVSGETAWITLNRGALVAALDQRAAERCVLDHPRLASMPENFLSELQGFGFLDTATYVERGYGTSSFLAAALTNLVRSPGDEARDPGTVLPHISALLDGAQPAVSFTRRKGGDLVSFSILDRSWTTNGTAAAGTPMSHSYGLIAAPAVVASIAIPNLLGARVSANENAAIATLRSISAAQAQFQASSVVDCDRDGAGEYGWFGELAGARPLRIPAPTGSAWGRRGQDELNPPFLASSFAEVQDDGTGEGVVARSGYYFKLFLPGKTRGKRVPGHGEPVGRASGAPTADPENSEVAFCCYAWPVEPGQTGTRAFFVNQQGDVLQLTQPGAYGGTRATGGRQPAFEAAYTARDMLAPLAFLSGDAGQDGFRWVPVGH